MTVQLFEQDCINIPKEVDNIQLVYLDPPYSCKSEDQYYGVGDSFEEYLLFIKDRLASIKKVLHPTGSNVLIHLDAKAVHYVKIVADTIFGRDNFQNEIIWCYASPSSSKTHLPRKHDTILWFGVGKYAFNQPLIPYEGKLSIGGKTSWNPDVKKEDYLKKGKKLEDYWTDIPSLCRNEKEKLHYSTQKPLALMKRIIETFSNPGDLVMDPFCGSGSFLDAANKLGRSCIGFDISNKAIEVSKKRLGINV